MEEKLGTIVVDGKLVDLDKTPLEDLTKLEDKLKNDEKKLIEKLDDLLQ